MAHSSDLSTLEQHLMLAIMRLREGYGLAIIQQVEQRTGKAPSIGAAYAALDRLEERGFVTSRQGEATPERGGKRKTYFKLTAAGQAALQQSLNAIASLKQGIRWTEAST